jgi:hypothetical protein
MILVLEGAMNPPQEKTIPITDKGIITVLYVSATVSLKAT